MPVGNPDARGGNAPAVAGTRWREDGAVAWWVCGLTFELDTRKTPLEFVRIESREDIAPRPVAPEPAQLGLRVVRVSDREARLETAESTPRILAVHRLKASEGGIDITSVTLSPDRSHAAYIVLGYKGGTTFVAQNWGFLLDLTDEGGDPRLLADPILNPVWHPRERTLFAFAVDEEREAAICEWTY